MDLQHGSRGTLVPEVVALTATLAEMPVAAVISDTSGLVVWANAPSGAFAGEYVWTAGVMEEAGARELLRTLAESGRASTDEEPRFVGHNVTPIRDTCGAITHALWIAHPVQDKQDGEEKSRSLFNSLNEGVAYCRMLYKHGVAIDWVYEEVNPAFHRLTGMQEVAGKRASELIPLVRQRYPEIFALQEKVVQTGVGERCEVYIEPLDTWFAVTLYPRGEARFVALFEDITEHRAAELELRESHDLMWNLARLVPGVIYQFRRYPDGHVCFPYASPGLEEIYEVRPDEVREDASLVAGRIHPEDQDRLVQATAESERTLRTLRIEFRMVLPRQGVRWRSAHAYPERLPDGSTLWHGIMQDITERKQAEAEAERLRAQLMQAQKMESVGRLAGGVAHDFNNLLTVINGYSGLMKSSVATTDPLYRFSEEISKAGARAAGLTRQLVAFSRKQVIEPRVVSLNRVVREALPMLERVIGEDFRLRTELAENLGYAMVDGEQIHQVIMNLAVNAKEAMQAGGELMIVTENAELDEEAAGAIDPEARPGRYIRLAISDTGEGGDEGTGGNTFEPFFTTIHAGRGPGLGLSMVYGMVRQSNGWIRVSSGRVGGAPGNVTTYNIYFPRVEGQVPERSGQLRRGPGQGTETILLVEDQDGVRAFAKVVLAGEGYLVIEASNGEEALRIAEQHPGEIHLLLTDVVLPGMNGKAVSERLTALYPKLLTIFCSGYTADVINRRGVIDDGLTFLPKPFVPDELLRKVRMVLDARQDRSGTLPENRSQASKVVPFEPRFPG